MIRSTRNYEIFKENPHNRDLDYKNLKNIISSIQACDMLKYRPILLNGEMQVIDGNHRLAAAKFLNKEVWYEVKENGSIEDIILLNQFQKKWEIKDWCKHYISVGNLNYLKLIEFSEKHQLTVAESHRLFRAKNGENGKSFKSGQFKFPDEKEIFFFETVILEVDDILEMLRKYTFHNKRFLETVTLKSGLISFLKRDDVNFQQFKNKLEYKVDSVRPCVNSSTYNDLFKEIYNWKNKCPIA